MKTIEEFLSYLCSLDVKLWVEENRLRCSAPKDVLTPVIKEELAERKEDILAFILNNNVASVAEKQPIRPVKRQGNLPLSFAQQRLWFLAQLEPESPFYNTPTAVRLQGQLNVEALQQSFNEIVSRHEALRTNFQTREGQAVAIISEEKPLTLTIFDISELPANQQQAEIKQQAAQETQQPFDISSDLLLRVKLLRLSEQEHILLLTMHHIVSDGWSIGVLVEELATLYQAFCEGQPSLLPRLPIQYVDFAAWQRQWLQGEVLETQISYWLEQLENAPKVLELPTDYPRPAIQTYRGATYSFELSKELSASLNKLSQQQGSTLFMTLLAGFQILLWRYTGQQDIVVGSPIANRNWAEIEGLIGFFVNTLVLRTNLAGNPSFEELLKRVREVALGAYAHQDLPFESLVEQLQPQRDLSHTPLFQVMFVLQNTPMSALELPGLTLTPLESDNDSAKFDLSLYMTETESGLVGSFEYNTDLFAQSSIQRMAGHLQTLFEGIIANSQQRLSDLPLLTKFEQHQLLREWNDTEVEYTQQQCIHELFEAQVEKTPDAIAVIFETEQLNYRELNQRTNQLAHYLRSLGVKPEVLVGICVERSLDMVIGLLAILKAGGAYLPLDPTYPQERLAYMLENAQVPILLTQQCWVEIIPEHKAHVICLDTDWSNIARESQNNPVNNSTANNLAYAIYTSGSTGKPKGVLGIHRGAVNRFHWMWQTYPFTQKEVCCQKTSLSFVDSIWEIFGPLLRGIPTVIIPDTIVKNPQQFVETLASNEVTRLILVPSLLRILLDTHHNLQKNLPKLKLWVTSGEALSLDLLQKFRQTMPESTLLNLYGSSEVSADVTCYSINPEAEIPLRVAIGRPIANTQIYVLDKYLKPVPTGIPGELYVSGAGIARGYLHQPEITAERFIPNPFEKNEPGARLYKTGDLARYLSDGNLEYIGRLDQQVKVRGNRIELGEIEAVLGQHPKVKESLVIATENEPNDLQQLIAYLVLYPEQTVTTSELYDLLKQKLPSYMIPSAFVMLEALPLLPNGKIDRSALPMPDKIRPELEAVYLPPQTEVEKTIANIWQEFLQIEKVGIHDNFFELGGHSLLLVQVHSKLKKIFQRDLLLVDVFQYPTINSFAKYLTQSQDKESLRENSYQEKSRTASINRRKQARQSYRATKQNESKS
jgi:amino acid adenylation domain-containing protein